MLLIFSGPSTIGKDSKWLRTCEQAFKFERIVPYTTREKRPNEKDGFDYNFVTKPEFHNLIQECKLLEWDYFNNNYYGTPKLSLDKNKRYVLHSLGRIALRIKQKMKNTFIVMLLPDDENIIDKRLRDRGYKDIDYVIRQNHYSEERDHALLFDFIIPNAETVTDYEAEKLIEKIIEDWKSFS